MIEPKTICIDFDGSCCEHCYPEIGKSIGAEPVLKELVEAGHRLILWTMRSGRELQAAAKWFSDRDIPLFGVNVNKTQRAWTTSPKAYANIFIDDAALGAPLIRTGDRPYLDWQVVREYLVADGYLK